MKLSSSYHRHGGSELLSLSHQHCSGKPQSQVCLHSRLLGWARLFSHCRWEQSTQAQAPNAQGDPWAHDYVPSLRSKKPTTANSETQRRGCELTEAGCKCGNAIKCPAFLLLELVKQFYPTCFAARFGVTSRIPFDSSGLLKGFQQALQPCHLY